MIEVTTHQGLPMPCRIIMKMADGTERDLTGFIVEKGETELDAIRRCVEAAGAVSTRVEWPAVLYCKTCGTRPVIADGLCERCEPLRRNEQA